MKKQIQGAATAVIGTALATGSAASAQQAVQWRVEDGGNGHWYAGTKIEGGGDWQAAHDLAKATGGALACFESVEEFIQIVPPIAVDRQFWVQRGNWWRGPWIGGFQESSDPSFSEPTGGWRWVSGTAISPEILAIIGNGNPNNYPCCEDRLQIGEGYLLPFVNDVPSNTSSVAMIIEWSADCNNDGIVDYGQILDGTFADLNTNGIPDVCESPTCADADLFADMQVNGADLGIMLAQWGEANSFTVSDLNGDGLVDGLDLGILLSFWGPCTP